MTKLSLSEIGEIVGGKDHATVLHSNKTVKNLMDTNSIFAWKIEQIETKLNEL